MILLKHNIASSRRKLHQGAALARIQERNLTTAATTERAALWRDEKFQRERDRRELEWEEHLDEASFRLQKIKMEQDEITTERIVENRERADRVQARHREIMAHREAERVEVARSMQVRLQEADARHEEVSILRDCLAGQTAKEWEQQYERAKSRKLALEDEKQQRRERELLESEERRQAGREGAALARQMYQNELMRENDERFLRHSENRAQIDQEERNQIRSLEDDIEAKVQAAAIRLQQHELEVQERIEHHALVREASAADAKARRDDLEKSQYREKVDMFYDEDLRRQGAAERRMSWIHEAAARATGWEQGLARCKMALEDEKREGMQQALVEMEEATALLEEWGWHAEPTHRGLDHPSLEDSAVHHRQSD